jgi:SNF2 family DNA or RNA helicase
MFILHGSWLLTEPTDDERGFVLWAETNAPEETKRVTTTKGVRAHPFAAPVRALKRAALELLPGAEDILRGEAKAHPAVVQLPSTRTAPQSSPGLLRESEEGARARLKLAAWQVDALLIPPHAVPGLLVSLPPEDDSTPGIKLGTDLHFWEAAGKFALELLARQRFAPALLPEGEDFLALWQPLLDDPADEARFERLVKALPPICRALSLSGQADAPAPRALLDNFLSGVVDEFARWHSVVRGHTLKASRYLSTQRPSTVAEAWLDALNELSPIVQGSTAELHAFYEQYRAWREPFPGATGADTFRLCFRLDPPPVEEKRDTIVAPKPNARTWALDYFLQATDDPSLLVPASAVWRERGSTLKFLNRKFDAPQELLLAGLGQASRMFPPIEASLRSARPEESRLTVQEAYTFIHETALLLQSSGFGVLVPGLNSALGVRVRLKPKQREIPKGGVAGLTFDSIIQYDWQLALGGEPLAPEEFEKLAALKVPLVQIRGQWVELKPEQVEQAIKFWEKRKGAGELSLQEALRLALTQSPNQPTEGLPITQVESDGWMRDLLNDLARGEKMAAVPVPHTFNGTLRPYQEKGLGWLAFHRQWGFGACLADDMGLGKTIQVAALFLHERQNLNGALKPALVICPTSVVSNWQRELARFAPDLRVLVHHGAARKKEALASQAAQHDVVISSYALLHRDEKHLNAVEWGDVILDEAQNIKNPGTKSAQVARKLPAQWRAALTGTPVENRLSELWSIFQFLNSGYLGSQEAFRKQLANPIERAGDPDATKQLKALVSPFILRRVKTDPTVISDLPQKNEMKVYCNLTKEQATLYEAVVRDSIKRIEEAEGIERRGIVLATLMKLKQVCNHPAQFLGDGSALPGRSGKLARLNEMLDEVQSVRERALVFTQFAEMGKLLQAYLQEVLGDEVLFLYGSTPTKARTKMIERFQNDPNGPLVFILSIKAGGTGLNLTRANHVFHFDRWWNPAVENQATDRAFRIGQTRNVQVYKYLCAGTFEEKIDAMIERKKELAASIVGESEQWITELSTDQLRDLFALRREAVGDV